MMHYHDIAGFALATAALARVLRYHFEQLDEKWRGVKVKVAVWALLGNPYFFDLFSRSLLDSFEHVSLLLFVLAQLHFRS
jgi:hypothetical protein